MQIKTTMKGYNEKYLQITNAREGVEKREPS